MSYQSVYTYEDFPSAWMRVLFRLHLADQHQETIVPGWPGWIPIYEVQGPGIGGSAGDVRLRDLRNKFRVPILGPERVQHRDNEVFLYRLGCDLDDADFTAILEEGADWRYQDEGQLELL